MVKETVYSLEHILQVIDLQRAPFWKLHRPKTLSADVLVGEYRGEGQEAEEVEEVSGKKTKTIVVTDKVIEESKRRLTAMIELLAEDNPVFTFTTKRATTGVTTAAIFGPFAFKARREEPTTTPEPVQQQQQQLGGITNYGIGLDAHLGYLTKINEASEIKMRADGILKEAEITKANADFQSKILLEQIEERKKQLDREGMKWDKIIDKVVSLGMMLAGANGTPTAKLGENTQPAAQPDQQQEQVIPEEKRQFVSEINLLAAELYEHGDAAAVAAFRKALNKGTQQPAA